MNGIAKVEIDGKEYAIVSNALLPKQYRFYFGRDFMLDLKALYKEYQDSNGEAFSSEPFERITWLMLRNGAKITGDEVPDTLEGWLETINIFDLYSCLEVVVRLLQASQKTTAKPKKK